jgi:non-lysosomal glucosylceramidase
VGNAPANGTVAKWPVACTYRGSDRVHVSLPVGGIGTGTIGFGGRGQFRDWELENHPSKGTRSMLTFLACQVHGSATPAQARVLEGDLFDEEVEGEQGTTAPLGGLPRFGDCVYETTYPFGRAVLADENFPVRASVEVFNPFSPGDEDLSGLPIAIVTVRLESASDEELDCSVMFSVEAVPGRSLRLEGLSSRPSAAARSGVGQGYLLGDDALGTDREDWGTIGAVVLGDGAWVGPTWGIGKWNQGLYEMWTEFARSGEPGAGTFGVGGAVPSFASGSSIAGTLGAKRTLTPGGTTEVVFVLGWHFPNRRSWIWGAGGPAGASGEETVGNFYANGYRDAWDVVQSQAPKVAELREVTERFVSAFWGCDLSAAAKEAALFNISTLRSQTFFRSADGRPFGWEGCLDKCGSCLGSCTHVWNYEMATGFLFGSLARQMRELEYLYATDEDGAMSFRIMLPLERARDYKQTAADGQFGCALKLFREWRLSGDDEWLRGLWPALRRSVEFAWAEGGWDADRDGLAEGAQHNTMDVEYYGPSGVIQSWYLAALAAAATMADALGDAEFAATCRSVYAAGVAATEATLFNGGYYQQKVIPPGDFSKIAPRLRHTNMGAEDPEHPEFQIGDGCGLDQLVGESYGRLLGLPGIFNPDNVRTTFASIHHFNYVADFGDWTNCVRTYGVRGERGHIVLSYPQARPEHPMPYWSEVWTGLEYVYAIGLAQIGEHELSEDVVRAARERFSGRRRNPFDEAECGHHYARAMSSWGVVVAFSGFGYDAKSGEMSFAAATTPTRWFWSNGSAWGTFEQRVDGDATRARLEVLHGQVLVNHVRVGGSVFRLEPPGTLTLGSYQLEAATRAG